MRLISIILIVTLLSGQVLATTQEAGSSSHNFLQETDITFWQTLPFALLWSYFAERQASALMFPGAEPHWQVIIGLTTIVSAGNALIQAQKVIEHERTGDH